MIRIRCKECRRTLSLRDSLAGKLIACPDCESRMRVPRTEIIEEADEALPRRRKRKRKKRRKSSGVDSWLMSYQAFLLYIVLAGGVLFLISLAVGPVSYALMVIGVVVGAIGGVWFLSIAYADSPIVGVVIPGFAIFYLITHWDETWRAFFLNLVGLLLALGGWAAVEMAKDRGEASRRQVERHIIVHWRSQSQSASDPQTNLSRRYGLDL